MKLSTMYYVENFDGDYFFEVAVELNEFNEAKKKKRKCRVRKVSRFDELLDEEKVKVDHLFLSKEAASQAYKDYTKMAQ